VANPAAGANAAFTVGSRRVAGLRVLVALFTLTTDANVADRFASVDYIDGRSVTRVRNAAPTFVTASTTGQVFQFDQANAAPIWDTGTMVFAPLNDIILGLGWTVQVTVDSKQAGDQLSAVSFVVENFYAD
jgi:hypothetical protein